MQVVVQRVTADYDRWALLKANEPLVVDLQARWKGVLVRRAFSSRLQFLRDHEAEAVKLQAQWKMCRQRKAYRERLQYLNELTAQTIKVGGCGPVSALRTTIRTHYRYNYI